MTSMAQAVIRKVQIYPAAILILALHLNRLLIFFYIFVFLPKQSLLRYPRKT